MADCRTRIQEKKYKRKSLKSRIRRLMRINNGITVVAILIVMVFGITTITGVVSHGFTEVTAQMLALEMEESINESDDKRKKGQEVNIMSEEAKIAFGQEMLQNEASRFYEATSVDFIGEEIRVFEYAVILGDTVIYDSFEQTNEEWMLDMYDKGMTGNKDFESVAAIENVDGEVVGEIIVSLSPIIIASAFTMAVLFGLAIFILNQILSAFMSRAMSNAVSKPLEVLTQQIEDLANDDLEDAFNVVLNVRKPVSEVVSLKDSTNEIMKKIAEYYEITTAQNEELIAQRDELESQRDELESQNETLHETSNSLQSMNNAYLNRTLKLQNLLDNVGQGFMTFDESLAINSEYSLTCVDMLCEHGIPEDLTGKRVTDYIFDDPEQREFIDSLLVKVIQGSEHERNLFLPLLPEEIELHGRIHRIEYKLVKDESFKELMMVILTDISETRDLENQMLAERDLLQMIVKVLLNRNDFLSLYRDFTKEMNRPFASIKAEEFDEILRKLHTFKGSFAQFYMTNIAGKLNDIEDRVYASGTLKTIQAIERQDILGALQIDIDNIKMYTSNDILDDKDLYSVKEEKIIEIEQKIKSILPATEFNKVIPIIKSIRYKSVREGLRQYPDYVTKLSERLEKSVMPFEIEGDDVFVDFDVYQDVFKSMTHLFRNAVDHGIETEDERIEADKNQTAMIRCNVVHTDDEQFEIRIIDDGRGIDSERIKAVALSKGLINDEDSKDYSEDDWLQFIFEHEFSTKDEATAISGRGVGLAAIKEQVEKLGGSLTVVSRLGKGTSFTVSLPILQGADIIFFEPEQFIEHIEEVATGYLGDLDIQIEDISKEVEDKIIVERVSSLINMKGSLDGLLVVSANETLSRKLVNAFILGGVDESEIEAYYEDVLGEITNTVLGNVLGSLEEEGIYLTMGVPVMLSNRSAYIKYSNRQIYSIKYISGEDIITFSILITENVDLTKDLSFDDSGLFFDKEDM